MNQKQNQNKIKINWKFLLVSIVMLVVANAFNGILTISSFETMYTDSVVSIYADAAMNLKRTIERPIQFGKPLHKFFGINTLLEAFKQKNADIFDVVIALPDGEILYSLDEKKVNTFIPPNLLPDEAAMVKSAAADEPLVKTVVHKGMYHIFLAISDKSQKTVGLINIMFKASVVKDYLGRVIQWNLNKLVLTTLAVSVLLFLCLPLFRRFGTGRFRKRRLYYLLFGFLILGQAAYSFFSISFFYDRYVDITHLKAASVQRQLQADLEKFLNVGIHIDNLNKMEERLLSITDSTSYIDNMHILGPELNRLYSAYEKDPASLEKTAADSRFVIQQPLESNGEVSGYIETRISKDDVQGKIIEIIMDSLTVLLISLIFITELLFFMFIFI